MAKLNDLSALSALLSTEDKTALAAEEAKTASKKKIGDGKTARLTLDKSGRRGKLVTVVTGIEMATPQLETLGQELRKECGAGGTLRGREIEIQGDQMKRVRASLEKRGFTVKP